MTVECTGNVSSSAYAASAWRQAFSLLEPLVGRSISEVLVDDLCENSLGLCKEGANITIEVRKTLDRLFGDGSEAVMYYLEKHLRPVED
jgi:hypothetical protein